MKQAEIRVRAWLRTEHPPPDLAVRFEILAPHEIGVQLHQILEPHAGILQYRGEIAESLFGLADEVRR